MAETLGSLIDRLSICNVKLWHIQERLDASVKNGEGLDSQTTAALHTVNLQRSSLINEINMLLSKAMEDGEVGIDPIVKIY